MAFIVLAWLLVWVRSASWRDVVLQYCDTALSLVVDPLKSFLTLFPPILGPALVAAIVFILFVALRVFRM